MIDEEDEELLTVDEELEEDEEELEEVVYVMKFTHFPGVPAVTQNFSFPLTEAISPTLAWVWRSLVWSLSPTVRKSSFSRISPGRILFDETPSPKRFIPPGGV